MSSSINTVNNNSTERDSSATEESLSSIYTDAYKYAPSKIIGTAVNLMMVPIFTSLLVPEQYGLYMIATGVINFLAIIFSDWVGISVIRFFKEHHEKDNIDQYFSTIMFLLTTNLLVMYILQIFFFKPIEDFFKIPQNLLSMVFIILIPVAIRALLFQLLRAQIKPLAYTAYTVINQLLSVGIAVFLIKQFNLGCIALLAAMSFSIVIIDFVMLIHTKYHKFVNYEKIKFNILLKIYKYGGPVAMASLGMWIITQSNKFILQYFKGFYYNGQLGVAYNLTFSIIMPLCAIIPIAAIPRLINKFEEGHDIKAVFTKLISNYFILFFPIAVLLCMYPKEVIILFSNSKFSDAYILIPFLSISSFFLALAEITTVKFYLAKKTWVDMAIRLFSGLIGIAVNIILIPKFPLLGIGIASLLSNTIYLILSITIKIKEIEFEVPYKQIFKTCLIIALCFTSIFGLYKFMLPAGNVGFIWTIGLSALLYTVAVKNIFKFS